MSGMTLLLIPLIVVAIVAIRIAVDRMDRARIRQDVEGRGGTVFDMTWAPFGRGWFGEKSDRIYRVSWADAEHVRHESSCKTSLFSGVYWTDEVPRAGEYEPRLGRTHAEDMDRLRAENKQLREELERLKRLRS